MEENTNQENLQENLANPTPGVAEQADNALADNNDDAEWNEAAEDVFEDAAPKQEGAGEGEENAQKPTDQGDEGQGENKSDAQNSEGQEQNKDAQNDSQQADKLEAIRELRMAQRLAEQELAATEQSVRQALFANVPDTLRDAEGDPIRGVEDVMKLINPNTGQPFTREEATEWYSHENARFQQERSQVDQYVKNIASVNMTVKDEFDVVNKHYGEFLKSNPELAQRLWAQYERTLTIEPKTQTIVNAPISILDFYNTVLQPYAEANTIKQQAEQIKQQAQEAQEKAQKEMEQAKRVQTRSDRSDIYSSGKTDNMDSEEKEWSEAAKEYFEN